MEHQEKKVPVMDLQKYAIVDASSLSETTRSMLKNLTERYGKNMVDGVVLSPHGEGKVVFIETLKKEGPIVEQINKLAEMYSLYPAYVVNEDKDHLPRFGKLSWYVVEAAIMLFDKPAGGLEEFKEKMSQKLDAINRKGNLYWNFFVDEKAKSIQVVFFNSAAKSFTVIVSGISILVNWNIFCFVLSCPLSCFFFFPRLPLSVVKS